MEKLVPKIVGRKNESSAKKEQSSPSKWSSDFQNNPLALVDRVQTADENELLVQLQELSQFDGKKKPPLPDELLEAVLSRALSAPRWIPNNTRAMSYYGYGDSFYKKDIYPRLVDAFLKKSNSHPNQVFSEQTLAALRKIEPSTITHVKPYELAIGVTKRVSPDVFGKLCWETMQERESKPGETDDSFNEYDKYHADAFWKQTFREALFSTGGSELQNAYGKEIERKISTHNQGDIRDTIHALYNTFHFNHPKNNSRTNQQDKNLERTKSFWSNVRNTLHVIRECSNQSSFVYLYTSALEKEYEIGKDVSNIHHRTPDSFLPFQIAPRQYGCMVTHNGRRELLASPETEFDEITTHLRRLKNIKAGLASVIERLDAISDGYSGIERDNWPYDIHYEEAKLLEEMTPYYVCEHEIRAFFFKDKYAKHTLASFDNRPREDRVIADESTPYIELYSENVRAMIEATYGFNITSLTLHEQRYFMEYLIGTPVSNIHDIQQLVKNHGITGIRAFLSLEHGGQEMGEKILEISKVLPIESAGLIFRKYAELVERSQDIESWLAREFKGGASLETMAAIANRLLERGKDLLVNFHQMTTSADDFLSLETDLDKISTELTTLLQTFKTLKESDASISLEDFQNTSFTDTHGAELPADEVSRMRSLYADSMQGYPEATKQELLADFDRHISDEQSRFSLLRYKGEIAGFLCFTETQPGQKYISAVTLDPRFQKAYIGEAMIDEAFAREASENILGADCVAQKSVSARYIENGFIGVRSWDDKGDLIMDIVRDDRRNEKYFSTKSLSQDEIIKLAPLGRIGTARIEVVSDPKEHPFSLCNEGFVLTRYFKDPASKKWYLVYEPKPTKTPATESISHQEEALA